MLIALRGLADDFLLGGEAWSAQLSHYWCDPGDISVPGSSLNLISSSAPCHEQLSPSCPFAMLSFLALRPET